MANKIKRIDIRVSEQELLKIDALAAKANQMNMPLRKNSLTAETGQPFRKN